MDFQIFPCCATMKAVAVEFKDLWKIRHPVGNCEGFNLNTFDNLIDVCTLYIFLLPFRRHSVYCLINNFLQYHEIINAHRKVLCSLSQKRCYFLDVTQQANFSPDNAKKRPCWIRNNVFIGALYIVLMPHVRTSGGNS